MKMYIKFYAKKSLQINDIERGIVCMEEKTNEKLNFSISKIGKPFQLDSRRAFLAPMLNEIPDEKDIPLITNAQKEKMIIFSGLFLTKGYNYAATPMWYLVLQMEKILTAKKLLELFESLTKKIDSYWGKMTSGGTEGRLTRQGFSNYIPSSKNDLPKIVKPNKYDSPFIPGNLGWISYWPAPTLKRIGFNDHHRVLFYSVKDAANDGLILQITKDPLDFEIEEHLRKTVAIYNALPAIGGRDCV